MREWRNLCIFTCYFFRLLDRAQITYLLSRARIILLIVMILLLATRTVFFNFKFGTFYPTFRNRRCLCLVADRSRLLTSRVDRLHRQYTRLLLLGPTSRTIIALLPYLVAPYLCFQWWFQMESLRPCFQPLGSLIQRAALLLLM